MAKPQRARAIVEKRFSVSDICLGKAAKLGKVQHFSLPARFTCPFGSKLAEQKNTICSTCYAAKGYFKKYAVVERAYLLNYEVSKQDNFVDLMVSKISRDPRVRKCPFVRLHSSGDFYCQAYFLAWCDIARKLPGVKFYAPTQERALVLKNLHMVPNNLVIRFSSTYIDEVYEGEKTGYLYGTMVYRKDTPQREAFICQGNCSNCLACWNTCFSVVAYKWH